MILYCIPPRTLNLPLGAAPLVHGEIVTEAEPVGTVAHPRVVRRRNDRRVVKARGHGDLAGAVGMSVRDGCSARRTECPCHRGRGVKLGRRAANEGEVLRGDSNPPDGRRTGGFAARAAVADHAGGRRTRDAIADSAAQAAVPSLTNWLARLTGRTPSRTKSLQGRCARTSRSCSNRC